MADGKQSEDKMCQLKIIPIVAMSNDLQVNFFGRGDKITFMIGLHMWEFSEVVMFCYADHANSKVH